MSKQFSSILRGINNPDRRLNILCAPTHPGYETGLTKTGHNFYALYHDSFVKWDTRFRPLPSNYHLLRGASIEDQLKIDITFDLVLSQNRFGQYQILSQIARSLNCPLITLEHTGPMVSWPEKHRQNLRGMIGDINVFISRWSIDQWGFDANDPSVIAIDHGINTDIFSGWTGGDGKILTVCNDYINRDRECGFSLYKQITEGLPVNPVGSTRGLSDPAKDVDDLVNIYRKAELFLNTSIISPIPTSLLEAASCGLPIVSTSTCMVPHIFENNVHGIISNDPQQLRLGLIELLNNKEKAIRLGSAARDMVLNRFSEQRFVREWNSIFNKAVDTPSLSWVHI